LSKLTLDVQKQAPGWKAVPRVAVLVRKAAERAIALSGIAVLPGAEIAVALADDAAVRAANQSWRKKDKPTNVLSFPSVPSDRISFAPYLGDIILAFETVQREAIDDEKPLANHLTHLIVHAVLHLLGYDHMTRADAECMEKLEIMILASLSIPDPYAGSDPLETAEA
jgi:probable rRNA maturation factor